MSPASRVALLASTIAATAVLCLAQEKIPQGLSVAKLSADRDFGKRGVISEVVAANGVNRLDLLRFVEIDGAGRIVVGGLMLVSGQRKHGTDVYAPGVARFLADGSPDGAFGDGGLALLPLRAQYLNGLDIDSQGRIVITGRFGEPGTELKAPTPYGAARLTDDGALDSEFSGDGLLEGHPGASSAELGVLAIDPVDGSLVAAAPRALVRITSMGEYDGTFGTGGRVVTDRPALDLEIDGQRRIIVAVNGVYTLSAPILMLEPAIWRFDSDGTRDLAFGTDGELTGIYNGAVSGLVEIDAQGRLVVGSTLYGSYSNIYRYDEDGTPDASFSGNGHAFVRMAVPRNARISAAPVFAMAPGAVQPYAIASILAIGRHGGTRRLAFWVQRYDPAEPGAVASYVRRVRRVHRDSSARLNDVAVTADGTAALAVGHTSMALNDDDTRFTPILLRVDFARRKTVPLPDFRVSWDARPTADIFRHRTRFRGTLRVRNTAGGVASSRTKVTIVLSDDNRYDFTDQTLFSFQTGRLDGTVPKIRSFSRRIDNVADDLSGKRLIAVILPHRGPDDVGWAFNFATANTVAVSAPLR